MTALVLAEHDGHVLKPSTLNAVTAVAEAGGGGDGVERVLLADDPLYTYLLAETVAPFLARLAKNSGAILATATSFGKNALPRVAASLDVQQILEIMAGLSPDTFVPPIYAGNALTMAQSKDAQKVITVRTTVFEPAVGSGVTGVIVTVAAVPAAANGFFVRQELAASERPELTAARVVISGARGMQNSDNFNLIEPIGEKLRAARAAVDASFVSNDLQVGQTGKIVARSSISRSAYWAPHSILPAWESQKSSSPSMKGEDAPIFDVADYGLMADLLQALPELDAAIRSS